MKIRCSLHRYHLPLVRPLRVGQREISSREGLILGIKDDSGHEGLGEIAPLPGFSRESMADASAQLTQVLPGYHKELWPESFEAFSVRSELMSRLDALYHSVSFGISSALFMLYAGREGKKIGDLIGNTGTESVLINALLTGSEAEILDRAKGLSKLRYKAAKLKVGLAEVDSDISLVRSLRGAMNSSVSLRLDANRRWTVAQAEKFLAAIADLDIEYIEEPVGNLRALPDLQQQFRTPIALDESLPEYFATGLQGKFSPAAVILKPTLLGGIGRSLSLYRWAISRKVKVVVSSSFETAVGMHSLINLASVISPGIPCGLDTSSWFSRNLTTSPVPAGIGEIAVPSAGLRYAELETSLLIEVPLG
jgi:o-succinylbenzoate synthase